MRVEAVFIDEHILDKIESKHRVTFDEAEDVPPRIFLLSSGEMTPFELTLSLPDKTSARLAGELTGKLTQPASDEKDEKKRS
mgnify:CR=1 FL=1